MHNHSPWLTNITRKDSFLPMRQDSTTDIAIIGGGISGIITAFFILEQTNKNIIILDSYKVGHGASGHNAGNLTTMLEISIPQLIEKYGEEKTKYSLQSLEHSWHIVEYIIQKTGCMKDYSRFTGYGGYSNKIHLQTELENLYYYKKWGLWNEYVFVSLDESLDDFPEHLKSLCIHVPQEKINKLLDTQLDTNFFAAIPERMAIANSALLCESLLTWCLEQYPKRCQIFEHTSVNRIHAQQHSVELSIDEYKLYAQEVIMCTNGFEHITLTTDHADIDTQFHHAVRGRIGYMASYFSQEIYQPSASWFYEKDAVMTNHPETEDPYFYITKRPFHYHGNTLGMMVVGGPEIPLEERNLYKSTKEIDSSIITEIDNFVSETFIESPLLDRTFVWHGLMGYTHTGLRIVGREPYAPSILYNLGCNGVGIMPAFWSGQRIVDIINNKNITSTIFDPDIQRDK